MKQPITKELIEQHLGTEHKIKRVLWWWRVDLASGASVRISNRRIDFGKYRELENRKNVCEDLFQMEARDSMSLGEAIWGGVGFYGKGETKDYAAVHEYAQSEGLNTGDQGRTFRHFGPEATIKYGWGSFTISLPDGSYMKFEGGAIQKVVGDLMRPALAMIHEITPDHVVVRGKAELLITAVHCGRQMGITVTPEGGLEVFIAVVANVATILCGVIAFQWVDAGWALLIGYVGGVSLCTMGGHLFGKQLTQAARRRGREIVGSDHVAEGRQTSIDDLRSKGML